MIMKLLKGRNDITLKRDDSSRFLPWIVAFMVYLAALNVAGFLVLNDAIERWDKGLSGTMTVQFSAARSAEDDRKRVDAVIQALREQAGVRSVKVFSREETARLLEPWLGDAPKTLGLALPHLVDVRLEEGATVDVEELTGKLRVAAPDATVDDHEVWLSRVIRVFRSAQWLSVAILILTAIATIATMIFTTRAALAIHHDVIDVLHMIGARDSYIARQFAIRASRFGFRGGAIGLILAVPTVLAIGYLLVNIGTDWLGSPTLAPWQWAVLATLPFVTALITMLTAQVTVRRTLARML